MRLIHSIYLLSNKSMEMLNYMCATHINVEAAFIRVIYYA